MVFPTLGSCNTCYSTSNDMSGLSVSGLVLSNSTNQYVITGNGFGIGSSGISYTPGGGTGDVIKAHVSLNGGSQPWTVGGGNSYNSLTLLGGVDGSTTSVSFGTPDGDLFIDSDMEAGAVTSSGPGTLHIGSAPQYNNPGSVNGTNGNPLTITGGRLIPNPHSTSGSLTMNSGTTLLLGTTPNNNVATTLTVNGTISLNSSTMHTFITGNGTTPGTDFSQLSANGNVQVGGTLVVDQGPLLNGGCQTLNAGDVATLVNTTGGRLSGTFSNAPTSGSILTMGSSCPGTPPQIQIQYTGTSVTATVVGGGGPTPTTTTLATPSPSPASTNQAVTLTAMVSSSVAPSGTVAFSANGSVIAGCGSQSPSVSGTSGTAMCSTSFAASGSPESLTATFTPASGSGQASSSSNTRNLTVNSGTTSTRLAASDTNPQAGGTVTYTATVTPANTGRSAPSGSVMFADGGSPISGCASQPLTADSATCTVSYPSAGRHSITASYGGDTNFSASHSSTTSVTVQPGTATPTSTALAASDTSLAVGGSVTYTATVTPGSGGGGMPSGSVAFADGGGSIPGCGSQSLTAGSSSSTATCTVSYPSPGTHTITAAYGGDGNFTGSSSSAVTVTVNPPQNPGATPAPATGTSASGGSSATTSRPSRIGQTDATLSGTVSTGGAAVTWRFEYGRTGDFGRGTSTHTIAAGRHAAVKVSLQVKKLSPDARYHYRLVVSTASQTERGNGVTFRTKPTGRMTGPRGTLSVAGRRTLLRVECRSGVMCRGRVTLGRTLRTGKDRRRKALLCARASVRIRAHRSGTVRLALTPACFRVLRGERHHRLPVAYTLQLRTGQLGERRWVMLVISPPAPPTAATRPH